MGYCKFHNCNLIPLTMKRRVSEKFSKHCMEFDIYDCTLFATVITFLSFSIFCAFPSSISQYCGKREKKMKKISSFFMFATLAFICLVSLPICIEYHTTMTFEYALDDARNGEKSNGKHKKPLR